MSQSESRKPRELLEKYLLRKIMEWNHLYHQGEADQRATLMTEEFFPHLAGGLPEEPKKLASRLASLLGERVERYVAGMSPDQRDTGEADLRMFLVETNSLYDKGNPHYRPLYQKNP